MTEFKAIPGTLGMYGINKSGEVKSYRRNRIVQPYRVNSVRLSIEKKKVNVNVKQTVALVFGVGYVDDTPDKMQNIINELNQLKDRIIILVQEIERDRKLEKNK